MVNRRGKRKAIVLLGLSLLLTGISPSAHAAGEKAEAKLSDVQKAAMPEKKLPELADPSERMPAKPELNVRRFDVEGHLLIGSEEAVADKLEVTFTDRSGRMQTIRAHRYSDPYGDWAIDEGQQYAYSGGETGIILNAEIAQPGSTIKAKLIDKYQRETVKEVPAPIPDEAVVIPEDASELPPHQGYRRVEFQAGEGVELEGGNKRYDVHHSAGIEKLKPQANPKAGYANPKWDAGVTVNVPKNLSADAFDKVVYTATAEKMTEPEPKSEPQPKQEPKMKPETQPKQEPEVKPEPQPKQEPEMKSEPQPKQEPKMKPETQPKQEPEMKPETQPKQEPKKPEPQPKQEPEMKPETQPKQEPEMKPETQPKQEPEKPKVISGEGQRYVKGTKQALIFISSADFQTLKEVRLDGAALVAGQDYRAESGSTKITLMSNLLERLSLGAHRLEIVSESGTAEMGFSVAAAESGNSSKAQPGGSRSDKWTKGSDMKVKTESAPKSSAREKAPQTGDARLFLPVLVMVASVGAMLALKKKQI